MDPFLPSLGILCTLVAVEYVSKCVEALATIINDHKLVMSFVKDYIFC